MPEVRSSKPTYFLPCQRVEHSHGINLLIDFIRKFFCLGLFSGAIYQSGHLDSECGVRPRPAAALQVLGSIVECNQINVEDQLKCLREVPASTLAGAVNSFPVNYFR